MKFRVQATDGAARCGQLTFDRGVVDTPAFMPVGTYGTVKAMTPEEVERVFEPFYTTKHRGSGLGLPIVRKIVEAHGGRVTLKSAPGRGSVFSIRLPLENVSEPGGRTGPTGPIDVQRE